jgi:hypothetical protein
MCFACVDNQGQIFQKQGQTPVGQGHGIKQKVLPERIHT